MRLETTSPTTSLRRPCTFSLAVFVSAIIVSPLRPSAYVSRSPQDRLDPRNVFAQPANLLQAFRLAHVQLKLQLEELVRQLALLVSQFTSVKFLILSTFISSSISVSKLDPSEG